MRSPNLPQSEMTASPDKYPQGSFKEKPCKWCQGIFKPIAPSHLMCSQTCADASYTDRYLRRNYGLTKQEYDSMVEAQGGCCKLCGGEGFLMDPSRHTVRLVVDHCHKTGVVRGLLCHNCNRALGLLKDDPAVLQKAIEYLRRA